MLKRHKVDDLINQVKTFNFQFPLEEAFDDNFQLFVEGIKHWMNHELLDAKTALEQLYLRDLSEGLANNTAVVLLGVLLALQDYDEIKRLKLAKAESVDKSEIGLALAFQKFPLEKYSFADLEDTQNFEFSPTGCPIIEVKINGVRKKLWLDTGASTSVLARSTANECGIKRKFIFDCNRR